MDANRCFLTRSRVHEKNKVFRRASDVRPLGRGGVRKTKKDANGALTRSPRPYYRGRCPRTAVVVAVVLVDGGGGSGGDDGGGGEEATTAI